MAPTVTQPALVQVKGIHHVAVAVADLSAEIERYTKLAGAELELRKKLPEQGVEAASLLVGDDVLELISPLAEDSAVARFLRKGGSSLHHVAYAVSDIERALANYERAGVQLLDTVPRVGLHGHRVAFIHPQAASGALTELVEVPDR